jgi:hypothetical protein
MCHINPIHALILFSGDTFLLLSFHLRLRLQSRLFTPGSTDKTHECISICPIRATSQHDLILLHVITRMILVTTVMEVKYEAKMRWAYRWNEAHKQCVWVSKGLIS